MQISLVYIPRQYTFIKKNIDEEWYIDHEDAACYRFPRAHEPARRK